MADTKDTKDPKDTNWALFDDKGVYKGGRVTQGEPLPKEEIPEGLTAVQVERFPQFFESWDPKSKSWVADTEKRDKSLARTEAVVGRRKGELDLPDEQTQRWFYALLGKLFPDTSIPDEVLKEYFPLIDPENKPKGVKRPKKLGRPYR